MASCTLFSKTYVKPSIFFQAYFKNGQINPKATKYPGSQVHRQATTTSNISNKYGKAPLLPYFGYSHTNQNVHLVKFTSVEGKRLFRNAMVQGHAEGFFKLMGTFSAQSSSSHGGISSLAMTLNALEIDPKRIWKGNWRWFSSEQLKTCSPAESIKERGIPFDEFACLAQVYCEVKPYRALNYEKFILDLESVTSDSASQMVVNYSRTALGQQGQQAHFSPIGGFNKAENQVLIMDVACSKYPSVWVNAKDLYRAMVETSYEEAGRSRGYFVLSNYNLIEQPQSNSNVPSKFKCQQCTRNCHA